jgi:DnaJ-class molecular chaperone
MNTQPLVTVFEVFELLGCNTQSSFEDIKAAWKRAAAQAHPDRGGDTHAFARLALAYRMLSQLDLRRKLFVELDIYGDICNACSGQGAHVKQRKFRVIGYTTCATCKGCGYTPKN